VSAAWEERRAELLDPPPLLDGARPAATIRSSPEDFQVEEIPAYPPDGGEGHLFLTLRKRGWTTEDALRVVARQLGVPRPEIGVAGQKDRHAVTVQWISLPAACRERLAEFTHPDLELGEPHPHSHKLRRGHLRANRFRLVVRGLDLPAASAAAHVRAVCGRLEEAGGLPYLFGPQRFGWQGHNVEIGLGLLERPWRIRPGDMALSALQGALFHEVWRLRRERGLLATVLEGDVLRKTATGGLFTSAEPAVDQQRLAAGELALTGPLFGSDRMTPPPGSPAAELEDEALAAFATTREVWRSLGKKAPGTRRTLFTPVEELEVEEQGDELVLGFRLEAGAFATRLLTELFRWREAERTVDAAADLPEEG